MRIRVTHRTAYAYAQPATWVIQTLRLSPRSHDGQYVADWRVEVDRDCRLQAETDAFGNTVHSFTLDGPVDSLVITASGEVETEDNAGVVRGQVERFPPAVFLRETALTKPDAAIRGFADLVAMEASTRLDILHALTRSIHRRMVFDTGPTDTRTTAQEAFQLGHGVCQDFAHIFIAAARHLEIPARYVGGYLWKPGSAAEQDAGHGWVEALVDDLGWVGFDPTNGISPTDAHIRVAAGLDYLGAAPVRGTRYGGGGETMTVAITVEEARPRRRSSQSQSQSQSPGPS